MEYIIGIIPLFLFPMIRDGNENIESSKKEFQKVLQTVARNYEKYNFFLAFYFRIWYNIFEDKENCNESFRLKSRIISFKQDIAIQKRKLV